MDETTTVMTPLMTHTGQYHYHNDKVKLNSRDFVVLYVGSFLYLKYKKDLDEYSTVIIVL